MFIQNNNGIWLIVCIISFVTISIFMRRDYASEVSFSHKHTIVATTSMLADAARIIVGDKMTVHCLMGCGIDPHLYRARESDVHKLAAADLVVYNGLHLEGKMGQVLEGMQRFTTVINASDVLDKQELRTAEFENLYDPHIWFDVELWISVVGSILEAIIVLDPEHSAMYQKNGDEYIAQLKKLHVYVQQRVNEVDPQKRILITAHDAFGYFGDAYGFQVVGLQGLSTDSDISTKDIQELADYIVEKQISTIFIETSISERSMRAVQEAIAAQGWYVAIGDELYSDALGDQESGADSYIGMVKHNVDVVVDALKK
jgi:manganese/zinc/iron transport system substrate-binding protein